MLTYQQIQDLIESNKNPRVTHPLTALVNLTALQVELFVELHKQNGTISALLTDSCNQSSIQHKDFTDYMGITKGVLKEENLNTEEDKNNVDATAHS